MLPEHQHQVFACGGGHHASTLKEKALVLLLTVSDVPLSTICHLVGKNDSMVQEIVNKVHTTRRTYVEQEEKNIMFGEAGPWTDVEADETVFRKAAVPGDDDTVSVKDMSWDQWCGIVERGRPETLVMQRLPTPLTTRRAPGPGAIKKKDWRPLANRFLKKRNIILHTDAARSYKLKVPGVLHDAVVHCNKRVIVNGQPVWVKPRYTRVFTHKVDDGTKVTVKGGTQCIDRVWQYIKWHLRGVSARPGSELLQARVRSAQWCYWNRHEDRWLRTGVLFRALAASEDRAR